MKFKHFLSAILISTVLFSCSENKKEPIEAVKKEVQSEFNFVAEQFADIKILRYQIPGFDELSLKQKKYVYYLTQAGLAGRDIMYDQNYRYNLKIRRALENIYQNYQGDKNSADWKNFETYLKQIWFANGIHHHYSNDKFTPKFTKTYFDTLLKETNTKIEGESLEVIFNETDSKKVNLNPDKGLIKGSAINFYAPNITANDVDTYYSNIKVDTKMPIEKGLNTKLVKENGIVSEKVYKSGGMYGAAIDQIIVWLEKAKDVTENEEQTKGLALLIKYYQTGDLHVWDEYNIVWAKSTAGDIDYISGFIEVYNDPKGYKGSYESVVQIKDFDMSKKMAA